MNRRSILKGLLLAPFAGLLDPISKWFGESATPAPAFRASRTHAQPQRIDMLSLKHWGEVVTQPIELYGVPDMVWFSVRMPEGLTEPKTPAGC